MSRELEPKQFLQFNGNKSLLQQTVARILPLASPENIYLATNEQYKFQIQHQAAEFKIPPSNIILEPQGKNTAPAIGLAAARILKRDPEAVMVVLPADHHIAHSDKLVSILKSAVQVAREDKLVTIGIVPTSANTGYGYIKIKSQVSSSKSQVKACPVQKFTEKPDKKTAEKYLKEKKYFWNSGMFVWKAGAILDEMKAYLPELYRALALISQDKELDPRVWAKLESISIDYGVLEKSKRVMVIPAKDLGWSDLGSWNAFSAICSRDKNGNVIQADCIDFDSKDISIFGKSRLIATIGLKNTVIVDTDDALLVCDKSRTEDVKKVVEHIKHSKRNEHFAHKTVKRPWGTYTVIDTGNGFKVKLVVIEPRKRLSLQRHYHRSEHWVVVEGEAKITIDRDVYFRGPNQSIYVPKKGMHRLENSGTALLKIVEVQCGQYLEEDDIERVEDDFLRK